MRFGLPVTLPADVAATLKAADRIAAYAEATALAGFDVEEADRVFGRPALPEATAARLAALEPLATGEAQAQFLARFKTLTE
jgi:5'-deoxynucleotidase YfbR-like HD superfamily hydrolase